MGLTIITADYSPPPRHRTAQSGPAHCEVCYEELSYWYNSIMWQSRKRDLCPEHAAEAAFAEYKAKR